jgi:preprotein translocase subunit YajC
MALQSTQATGGLKMKKIIAWIKAIVAKVWPVVGIALGLVAVVFILIARRKAAQQKAHDEIAATLQPHEVEHMSQTHAAAIAARTQEIQNATAKEVIAQFKAQFQVGGPK